MDDFGDMRSRRIPGWPGPSGARFLCLSEAKDHGDGDASGNLLLEVLR